MQHFLIAAIVWTCCLFGYQVFRFGLCALFVQNIGQRSSKFQHQAYHRSSRTGITTVQVGSGAAKGHSNKKKSMPLAGIDCTEREYWFDIFPVSIVYFVAGYLSDDGVVAKVFQRKRFFRNFLLVVEDVFMLFICLLLFGMGDPAVEVHNGAIVHSFLSSVCMLGYHCFINRSMAVGPIGGVWANLFAPGSGRPGSNFDYRRK